MQPEPTRSPAWSVNYWIIVVSLFIFQMASSMNSRTVLPGYIIQLICDSESAGSNCTSLANIREANQYIVNMSIINNLAALISIGTMIYCAENFGRKPVYAVICLGVALDNLGLGLAHTPLLVSILHSASGILGNGYTVTAVTFSMVADISTPDQRTLLFGILESSLFVGGLLGPLVGGLVQRNFGFQIPFFVAAASMAVSLLMVLLLLKETLPTRRALCGSKAPKSEPLLDDGGGDGDGDIDCGQRCKSAASYCLPCFRTFTKTWHRVSIAFMMLTAWITSHGALYIFGEYMKQQFDFDSADLGIQKAIVYGIGVFSTTLVYKLFKYCLKENLRVLMLVCGLRSLGNALMGVMGALPETEDSYVWYTAMNCIVALGYSSSLILRSMISRDSQKHNQAVGLGSAASLEITGDLIAPLLGYVFVFTTSIGYPSFVYFLISFAWFVVLSTAGVKTCCQCRHERSEGEEGGRQMKPPVSE